MSKNLKTQWRVQVRKSRGHYWVNKGLFETREEARRDAVEKRALSVVRDERRIIGTANGYGFGNTRVVKYVRAA